MGAVGAGAVIKSSVVPKPLTMYVPYKIYPVANDYVCKLRDGTSDVCSPQLHVVLVASTKDQSRGEDTMSL